MHGRRVAAAAIALAWTASANEARAGGFELPDNGTQALGRGGAFVAKADDATAIHHNPAGLARQRGTNVLVNGNLILHSFTFQRAGTFPDDPNQPETPWGDQAFPAVRNVGGPFFAPFLAVTSDFHTFDRLTFALGVYGPPAVGNRTFPLGVDRAPAASRYDFVQSRSTIIYPTASAGFRVTKWLDVGVSGHLVVASFDQTNVSFNDFGVDTCKNVEFQPCDSRSTLVAKANSFGATLGAMVRPSASTSFGMSFRTPINIEATGVVTPQAPRAAQVELAPGNATLALQLPWMLRLGGRYVAMDGNFELYDLELDVTYEAWGTAQGLGPIVRIPDLGAFKNIETVVLHRYSDTFGLRGGGAYNIEAGGGVLSLRGGAYFDSSATQFGTTRLDFDTLAKVAGTLGVGFKIGAYGFDFTYAAIASIPRVVGTGQGEVRPVNGLQGGRSVDANDQALPAVNEGAYRGFTHILSFGVRFELDGLFGAPRPIRYGNPYEPGYVPGKDDEKPPEDKPKDEPGDEPEEPKVEEKKPPKKEPDPPPEPEEPKVEEKKPPKPPPKEPPKPPTPTKEPSGPKAWWDED